MPSFYSPLRHCIIFHLFTRLLRLRLAMTVGLFFRILNSEFRILNLNLTIYKKNANQKMNDVSIFAKPYKLAFAFNKSSFANKLALAAASAISSIVKVPAAALSAIFSSFFQAHKMPRLEFTVPPA